MKAWAFRVAIVVLVITGILQAHAAFSGVHRSVLLTRYVQTGCSTNAPAEIVHGATCFSTSCVACPMTPSGKGFALLAAGGEEKLANLLYLSIPLQTSSSPWHPPI